MVELDLLLRAPVYSDHDQYRPLHKDSQAYYRSEQGK